MASAIKERYIVEDLVLGNKVLIQDFREGFPEEAMIYWVWISRRTQRIDGT